MRTVAQRIEWLGENFKTKDGHPFSVKGREWVVKELFEPVHGWRVSSLARQPDDVLCDECQPFAGRIVPWSEDLEDAIEGCGPGHDARHRCAGLELVPIQVVILCLPRREGKTFNFAGLVSEYAFNEENKDTMFVAAGGDQAGELFDKNFLKPLRQVEALDGEWEATTTSLRVKETESEIEVVPCSERSITGRGKDLLVVDEAKDVDGDVFTKAIFSVRDRNGLVCRRGHRFPMVRDANERPVKKCPTCTGRLRPYFGQIIIASSAGKLDANPDYQWFAELIELQTESPEPWVHLYRRDESQNPAVAKESNRMLTTFGKVPSLADTFAGESANSFTTKGSQYITDGALAAVTNHRRRHAAMSHRPCLAFFDTAQTRDLISLVVMEDDDGSDPFWKRAANAAPLRPWSLLSLVGVWTWKPAEIVSKGANDEQALVELVDAFFPILRDIMPGFPQLRELWIDVRARRWAHQLVDRIQREKPPLPFRAATQRYQWGKNEQDIKRSSYKLLEQRVDGRTIQLFDHQRIKQEIRGMKKRWLSKLPGDYEVFDVKRKIMHADVVSGIAALCERAWHLEHEKKSSMGDLDKRISPSVRQLYSRASTLGKLSSKLTPDGW